MAREHDLGRPAGLRSPRLHLLLRAAGGDGRHAGTTDEHAVPPAPAADAPDRRPAAGFLWALLFNGIIGARLGVFHYGRVIPGLALREGTKHQYPLYDALAMGIQAMVFSYLLGRTDPEGRTVIEVTAGPTEQLFPGVPNQPLHGR